MSHNNYKYKFIYNNMLNENYVIYFMSNDIKKYRFSFSLLHFLKKVINK